MKKVFALMLVCVCAFAVAACGDDDDGGGVDNVAACENLEETLNELECVAEGWDWNLSCDSYDGTTCDYAEYFDCLAECYVCTDDDPPVLDASTCVDCTIEEC